MKYPKLRVPSVSRQMIDVFKGYNHNLRIGDGEFYDMTNMSSEHSPILAPRKPRGVYAAPVNPLGMVAKDSLCYVDGADFVIDGYPIAMGLSDESKQLVSMGAYVIILPDKKYINTADLTDFGNIEAEVTTNTDVSFTLCRMDGTDYQTEYIQAEEPESPEDLALWIDTSSVPHTLKQWAESSGMWVSIATTYVKISAAGIGVPFEKYDGVNLSGLSAELTDSATGESIADTSELAALEGTAVIWDKGDNYIVIVGILDKTWSITNPVTVARKMPNMDFVVESENRLWGCRYGPAANGQIVNELYACKLGDFKNWNCFMSISTDSYAVSLGTDGQFTGAITHLGHPLFFKENFVHKVYGNYPANFQVQTTACRGVQKGCEKSLAIVGETLFYKARSGVCAYDGSLPVEASEALGNVAYTDAAAGACGNKYYISMMDPNEVRHLFVYDTGKGMWHREDNLHADSFCACKGQMYCIDHGTKQILALTNSEGTQETVEWMVQTGEIGLTSPDAKYVSRLNVRMVLEQDAVVKFSAQYDFSEEWEHLFTTVGTDLRSFSVPIRPKRCDYMRLRIEGEGNAKIYSITKTIEQGSDIT